MKPESTFGDVDLHLFREGNHFQAYQCLGAHLKTVNNQNGVHFAVWAPNAKNVSLIGDFNQWAGDEHGLIRTSDAGIWELFVPNIGNGTHYKFRIETREGEIVDKTDPYGFQSEVPPRTASVVCNLDAFAWSDQSWMERRKQYDFQKEPISVYEVHPGSWRQDPETPNGWLNYRDLAHQLVEYCSDMGFTHIELMPVSEHPFTGSWGYQTVGYFAATSRYGTPEDLMYLIDYCHLHGIGVIIDWVPAHFPKDGHGLARFDGTHLFEHEDPKQGYHPDWDTLIFNYGRAEVRNFLISNALFWFDKFHVDGLRVDAVASMLYLDYSRNEGEWVPNKFGGRENLEAIDFLKTMNEQVHAEYPGALTIAEESTAWGGVSRPTYCGGLGFSIKWNMGWMNDTLRYIRNDPVHRKYHHDELTFSLIYAFTENFMLPFSHDEVVHGKGALLDQMPGDTWQKFANLRLLFSYMWTHPGKKLSFMGNEIGQWTEWDCNQGLNWDLLSDNNHRGLQTMVGDLNRLYRNERALFEADFEKSGFDWIDCMSREKSLIAYLRKSRSGDESILICCNFTPVVHTEYRIGVPEPGTYRELFNSDSGYYGGTNVGNGVPVRSEEIEAQGREHSIQITVPPLGAAFFKKQ